MTKETTMTRWVAAALVAVTVALGAASAAHAEFGIKDGTFTADVFQDGGALETQAGAHPARAITRFDFTMTTQEGIEVPDENLKDLELDLPAGFIGNPQVAPTCAREDFARLPFAYDACPLESQVGVAMVANGLGFYDETQIFPVYNVEPRRGDPADFGFYVVFGAFGHIVPEVRSNGDYGLTAYATNNTGAVGIAKIRVELWGVPADPIHDDERACLNWTTVGCETRSHPGPRRPFLSNPTACAGPQTSHLRVTSWQDPADVKRYSYTTPVGLDGCEAVPFDPTMSVSLGTTRTDAPTGMTLDLGVPQDGTLDPDGVATAHLRHAKVTLPEGMTINPSAARGLTACTDGQMGLGDAGAVRCPDASRIGNVWARTPLLDETLGGGIYVASQQSDDPGSGRMFRLFLQLESEERGIRVKLPGAIRVDEATGRIEATFRDNPQLPVSELRVQFKGGERAPLATPSRCGAGQVVGELQSWAGHTRYVSSSVSFPCAERGFAPSFAAGSLDASGGAFSPFTVRLGRQDGSQYLKDLRVELPTGVLAKLDGVPLCGDAAANAGACPGESRVGTATVGAGAGDPFFLQGGVYLTGPYGGGPFGLAVITRAVAGPFELGTVVVRQAIDVDPRDARITIRSDAFPQIVKGVPLRLRSIVVDMDRPGFMVNPTDCGAKEIRATIGSADGTSVDVTQPFAAAGCDKLAVEPNLQLQLTDRTQTRDGDHPGLVANLALDAGGANLRQVAVGLPLSLALDVNNAQALCTPEQAQAKDCPAGSIVGTATAVTPLLHEPLTGNVYFVEGRRTTETGAVRRTFPKLWVALRGAIALDVWADTDVDASQRLVTTFASIPDAPISRFELKLAGGEHGILALNTNVCRGRQVATSAFEGHNGRRATQTNPLTTPCASTTAASKAKPKKARDAARRAASRRASGHG